MTALTAIHDKVIRLTARVGVFVVDDMLRWDFSYSNNSFYLGW